MPVLTATPTSTKTPGFYLGINLLASGGSPGTSALRALLVAHPSSAGDIEVETEVRTVYGADEAAVALGEGVPGHLAAIQAFEAFGALQLDIVSPAAPTGAAASGSYVISGTPTDTNFFEFEIQGRKIGPIGWAEGETGATFHTRVKEHIAGESRLLSVTPATGSSTSVVDLDAKTPGTWGNDIVFSVKKLSGTGGAVLAVPLAGKLADGVGELDPTDALALVDVQEYALIGLATSNTDAADNTGTAGPEVLMDHIEGLLEGGEAKLQYGFVGLTDTIANAKAGAIGRNSVAMTYAYLQNGRSLPAEVMGWELGNSARWYTQRANYNRIGLASPLVGSADLNADKLRLAEKEDLLRNGVSPYDFQANTDEVVLVCPITTHSADSGGNPDFRCFYQADTFGAFAFCRDLRAFLPAVYKNVSISQDLPADAEQLPAGVVERRDVAATVYARARSWVRTGVLDGVELEEAIADGTFAIEIDADNESKVNIFIPVKIIKPLAQISVVVHKVG